MVQRTLLIFVFFGIMGSSLSQAAQPGKVLGGAIGSMQRCLTRTLDRFRAAPLAQADTIEKRAQLGSALRQVPVVSGKDRFSSQVVVGDIHGDPRVFHTALRRWGVIDGKGKWIGGRTQVVVIGDIPDKGSRTLDALDEVIRIHKEATRGGGQVKVIIGNHDAVLLGVAGSSNASHATNWLRAGGDRVAEEIERRLKQRGIQVQLDSPMEGAEFLTNEAAFSMSFAEVRRKGARLFLFSKEVRDEFKRLFGPGTDYWRFYREHGVLAESYGNVAYVHGGFNRNTATQVFGEINREWSDALSAAESGNELPLLDFANRVGRARSRTIEGDEMDAAPFWQDVIDDSVTDREEIGRTIRERDGITLVVGGHAFVSNNPNVRPKRIEFGNEGQGFEHVMIDTGASEGYSGHGESSVFVHGGNGKVYWYNKDSERVEELTQVRPR